MKQKETLTEIATSCRTDKAGHGFTAFYEEKFERWREDSFELLEIGILEGASLRMWRRYFPRASIRAVDISSSRVLEVNEAGLGMEAAEADQGDPQSILRVFPDLQPRIIVDDGSHLWAHQMGTLEALWPKIRPGGVFVMEDLHTSFLKNFQREARESTFSVVSFLAGTGNLRDQNIRKRFAPMVCEVEGVEFFHPRPQSLTAMISKRR